MNPQATDDTLLLEALRGLLDAECPPARVRAGESGGSLQALTDALTGSGFADAMLPEAQGGAGLSLSQAFPLFELCGRYLLPLPLPEQMVARALGSAPSLGLTVALNACLNAAQMAGALQRVLEMTLQYANDRQQFGRPIGKFQAIQHQLAVMAEHVMAARMAAQIGCQSASGGPGRPESSLIEPSLMNVAVAKARSNDAAVEVTALAHSIFGAIGFTAEHDLQLYTRRLHAWRLSAGTESYWHEVLGQAVLASPHAASLDILQAITAVG